MININLIAMATTMVTIIKTKALNQIIHIDDVDNGYGDVNNEPGIKRI